MKKKMLKLKVSNTSQSIQLQQLITKIVTAYCQMKMANLSIAMKLDFNI